jgi:hypothetical protein
VRRNDYDEDSKLLDAHCNEGESQTIEFKEKVPDNIRELAKNIASFATSNQGTIYIGIDDSANIIGIRDDIHTPQGKDGFQLRILGIVRTVEPPITVDLRFIQSGSHELVKIIVPRGSEPLYFVSGIPYIRDLSTSRQAKPNEVKELHLKYFQQQIGSSHYEDNIQEQFLVNVLSHLSDVELALSDIEYHLSDPNLSQLKYDLGSNGQILLEFSSLPAARSLELQQNMKELGLKLKDMEAYKFYLGREYYDRFVENGKNISKQVEPLIGQLKRMIVNSPSDLEFKERLETAVEDLRNNWELGKRYRASTTELERLKDTFRISAYHIHKLVTLYKSENNGKIQSDLFEISKRLRALSTPEGFGLLILGFDNVSHITPEVEACFRMAERAISEAKKL